MVRVIAIFFVMLIHSPAAGASGENISIWICAKFIGEGAVPIFFMMSGFLAAKSIQRPDYRFKQHFSKCLHRLIIPYLLWNAIVLMLALGVKLSGLTEQVSEGGAYFDFEIAPWPLLNEILGIGKWPIVYQFWFLRDLIIAYLVSFFLIRVLHRMPMLPLLFLAMQQPLLESIALFLLGAQLKSVRGEMWKPTVTMSLVFCVSWIVLGYFHRNTWITIFPLIMKLGSIGFIFLLSWMATLRVSSRQLIGAAPIVFFVYATHEPLQTVLGRFWTSAGFPGSETFWYFILISVVSGTAGIAGYLAAHRFFPSLTGVLTGGRSEKSNDTEHHHTVAETSPAKRE